VTEEAALQRTIPWGFGDVAYVQVEQFDLFGNEKLVACLAVQPAAGGPARRIPVDSEQADQLAVQHPGIAEVLAAYDDELAGHLPPPTEASAQSATPPAPQPEPPANAVDHAAVIADAVREAVREALGTPEPVPADRPTPVAQPARTARAPRPAAARPRKR
jgi:hypothetical protein